MKEILFRVVTKNSIPLNLTIQEIRAFPTHKNTYSMYDEKIIIIEYRPANGFDLQGYIKMLTAKIKKQYKAQTVEVISRKYNQIEK